MKILSFIGQLVIGVGIIALAGVLASYKGTFDRALDLQAQHDCAQDYRLEFTDEKTGTTVIRPVEDLYQTCLSAKE